MRKTTARGLRCCATSSGDTATAWAACWKKRRASSHSACPTRTPSGSPTSKFVLAASRGCAPKRTSRTARFRIAEFFHPRTQEIADTLPAALGRWLIRAGWARALVDRATRKGRLSRPRRSAASRSSTRRRASSTGGAGRCASRPSEAALDEWLALMVGDRADRLRARRRGGACPHVGEGIWRHPCARAGEVWAARDAVAVPARSAECRRADGGPDQGCACRRGRQGARAGHCRAL